jgi:ribose 5-phosphate isomerase A
MIDVRELKRQAAEAAVAEVQSDMVVGLGGGSTAAMVIELLAGRVRRGELTGIRGVPCARSVERQSRDLGLEIVSLDVVERVDLTIDGADEVDPQLNLIKGGGGALLWEKIVALASDVELIVVDEGKLSARLGERCPVPVEVIPPARVPVARFIAGLGGQPELRLAANHQPFLTDEGNLILDCQFGPLYDPAGLGAALKSRTGVVEHGLFLGLASQVIIAGRDGVRRIRQEEVRG